MNATVQRGKGGKASHASCTSTDIHIVLFKYLNERSEYILINLQVS